LASIFRICFSNSEIRPPPPQKAHAHLALQHDQGNSRAPPAQPSSQLPTQPPADFERGRVMGVEPASGSQCTRCKPGRLSFPSRVLAARVRIGFLWRGGRSASSSTLAKNLRSALEIGWPPPIFVSFAAILAYSFPSGTPMSLYTSRKAHARSCSSGLRQPSLPAFHESHKSFRHPATLHFTIREPRALCRTCMEYDIYNAMRRKSRNACCIEIVQKMHSRVRCAG
jgi:hypothetical protein